MTNTSPFTLTPADCSRARFARDARFDGLFFVAVKTTGIFCRPVCPVVPPLEDNVEYFDHAAKAYQAGYRPCLRCRPDSAPGSCAWRGTDTTFTRALALIDEGALQTAGLPELAARLGISDRYLRQLFQQRLGLSPKAYAIFGQVMFAKKLLHETSLSITDIASAAGFNSLRRFNDAFVKHLQLAPSAIRRDKKTTSVLCITLAYRPPLNWEAMLAFWRKRSVSGIEWVDGESYGRTFTLQDSVTGAEAKGIFEVSPLPGTHALQLNVQIDNPVLLKRLVARVRQILDLDADINLIEQQLSQVAGFKSLIKTGLRIPGIWHPFEAGVRAILGQQVSVAAARTHLERLVHGLAECDDNGRYFFPNARTIADSDLAMLKMPASRRETLQRFAHWYQQNGEHQPVESWLQLKGIGRWTVDYVQMRAHGHTDIWLAGDLGIKKALAHLNEGEVFNSEQLKPWRSYATFHLWNHQI
jgi:AraC family transcriptional regulator of adaptative response / DNA-3-methyladenine glycosylase II